MSSSALSANFLRKENTKEQSLLRNCPGRVGSPQFSDCPEAGSYMYCADKDKRGTHYLLSMEMSSQMFIATLFLTGGTSSTKYQYFGSDIRDSSAENLSRAGTNPAARDSQASPPSLTVDVLAYCHGEDSEKGIGGSIFAEEVDRS